MSALYQEYRPKNFSDVINQEHIKTTLLNAVRGGSFAHAYLFSGPRGTGKTTLARIFARAINCENPKNGEPCNKCRICQQFLSGNALDLTEIDAASNTGVENIREIIEHLKFSPTEAKYKVFIIDEVHMLSKGAFNALLKTLEEPPKHAIFILATTEVHKVPPTVISRTQRFDFKRIDNESLAAHLKKIAKQEKIDIDDQSLRLIVNSSEGSARDALSVLDKLSSFGKLELQQVEMLLGITNVISCQQLLEFIHQKDAKAALQYVQELFAKGADPIQFNKDFLEYLRKLLMHIIGANENFALDQSQMENLRRQAKEIKVNQLLFIIRLFLRANKDFQISPSPELPIEIAVAEASFGENIVAAEQGSMRSQSAAPAAAMPVASTAVKTAKEQIKSELKPEFEEVSEETFESKRQSHKTILIDEVLSSWPEILQKVKVVQSPMLAVLQNAKVRGIEANRLSLVFSYKFHKDSIDNKKNQAIFLKVLGDHFDSDISLETIFEKDLQNNTGADASNLALEVFGGEII